MCDGLTNQIRKLHRLNDGPYCKQSLIGYESFFHNAKYMLGDGKAMPRIRLGYNPVVHQVCVKYHPYQLIHIASLYN